MNDSNKAIPDAPKKMNKFWGTFLTGLMAALPALLTIFIVIKVFDLIYTMMAMPTAIVLAQIINLVFGSGCSGGEFLLVFFGFMISMSAVYLAGWLLAGLLSNRLVSFWDWMFTHIPVIKAVYPYAKQVVDFFTADHSSAFSGVVVVQYPRKGLYSLAFVTGQALKDIRNAAGDKEMINVFIPSTPTPLAGYAIFVPREDVFPIDLTVEETLRFTLTGGMLVPDRERIHRA